MNERRYPKPILFERVFATTRDNPSMAYVEGQKSGLSDNECWVASVLANYNEPGQREQLRYTLRIMIGDASTFGPVERVLMLLKLAEITDDEELRESRRKQAHKIVHNLKEMAPGDDRTALIFLLENDQMRRNPRTLDRLKFDRNLGWLRRRGSVQALGLGIWYANYLATSPDFEVRLDAKHQIRILRRYLVDLFDENILPTAEEMATMTVATQLAFEQRAPSKLGKKRKKRTRQRKN